MNNNSELRVYSLEMPPHFCMVTRSEFGQVASTNAILKPLQDWCKENYTGIWRHNSISSGMKFYANVDRKTPEGKTFQPSEHRIECIFFTFEKEDDKTHFLMRWGGEN